MVEKVWFLLNKDSSDVITQKSGIVWFTPDALKHPNEIDGAHNGISKQKMSFFFNDAASTLYFKNTSQHERLKSITEHTLNKCLYSIRCHWRNSEKASQRFLIITYVMVALFTKICSGLLQPMAPCLQHLYFTSKAKLLSFWNLNSWASLANDDVSEHPQGGGRSLKLTVVVVCCRQRGGGVDVFEVARVTEQVSVQRIAAVTLLVIQLHVTVLGKRVGHAQVHGHLQIFEKITCQGIHVIQIYFQQQMLLALKGSHDAF